MCVSLLIFTGLSLKTQELTSIFLIMRIICHFMYIRDIYIVLDSITLGSTLWVIYMIRYKLKNTYLQDLDNMPFYYVVRNFISYSRFWSSLTTVHSNYNIVLSNKQKYSDRHVTVPCLQLVPAFVIAFVGNPGVGISGLFYMYSKVIEAVSVLPQLRLIQNAKVCTVRSTSLILS